VITVPRQSTKTTWAFSTGIARGGKPDHRTAYMAQAGTAMIRKFRADLFTPLEHSILGPSWQIRRGAGDPGIEHRSNGSYLQGFPPVDGSLRNSAQDLVIVDEGQEHDAELGAQLAQTILPTMTTRPRRQLWMVGTAPDAAHADAWFRTYYDRGLAGEPGVCLVDYGIGPDDDPDDPETVLRRHPGVGLPGVNAAFFAHMRQELSRDQYLREFLNLWPDPEAVEVERPIDPRAWQALADTVVHGPRRWLGFDVSLNRRTAALAGASLDAAGRPVASLLWRGPTQDLQSAVREHRRPSGGRLAGIRGAPSQGDTCEQLRELRLPADVVTAGDYAGACQRLADLVNSGRLAHDGHPDVLAALVGAGRSWRTDAWVWAARLSDTDITPLVAITLAVAAAATAPGRPVLRVRRHENGTTPG
jgi:hypothetical protein